MNRKIEGGLWCALIATMTACSSDTPTPNGGQNTPDTPNEITMTVPGFKVENLSRSFVELEGNTAQFTWDINDKVGIFPNQGNQVIFPMTGGENTNTATFTGGGWALKPASAYAAYYPVQMNFDLSPDDVCYDYKKQSCVVSTNKKWDVKSHDVIAAKAITPADGKVNFEFKHLGCLMMMDLQLGDFPEGTQFKKANVTRGMGDFCITASMKGLFDTGKEPFLKSLDNSSTIFIDLTSDGTVKSGGTFTLYFMLPPNQPPITGVEDDYIGINLELMDTTTGKTFYYTYQTNPLTDTFRNLKAGTAYRIGIKTSNFNPIPDL